MRSVKKIAKIFAWIIGSLLMLLVILFIYMAYVGRMNPPEIANRESENWQRKDHGQGFYTLKNNWFRKSNTGLYELYVEGNDFERGVVNGKLTAELVQRQEDHFNEQISRLVPGTFHRHFLKYFIGWFNRDLEEQVRDKDREEIYGISLSASEKYNYIGTNYSRILNYHAAHDIGHALQTMALVGCTSFGTWNEASADSSLIIGRNFDFYAGDKFAEDKIVAFVKPAQGYAYMIVTWGGFTGAVSGMNVNGLTVTINAAKTKMPTGTATPVSLVAKEILQHASNIEEAKAIAAKRKMFVSESFLIGSAADRKAILVEKTPEGMAAYDPNQSRILCTNHFQSKVFYETELNKEQRNESASDYRYHRLQELIDSAGANTVEKTVNILRNQKGLKGLDIGLGNEKAVNQLIAHHAIVFEPEKRRVWVSTAPWQLGAFVAYDLNKVFGQQGPKTNTEIYDSAATIGADPFLQTRAYQQFLKFRHFKQKLAEGGSVSIDSLVNSNPNYYHTYVLAGDFLMKQRAWTTAETMYRKALTLEIATKPEKDGIMEKLAVCIRKKSS